MLQSSHFQIKKQHQRLRISETIDSETDGYLSSWKKSCFWELFHCEHVNELQKLLKSTGKQH